jgi:hypothetical protein
MSFHFGCIILYLGLEPPTRAQDLILRYICKNLKRQTNNFENFGVRAQSSLQTNILSQQVIQRPGVVEWRYRLRLPPKRLELWVVRSNPARLQGGSFKKSFMNVYSPVENLYLRIVFMLVFSTRLTRLCWHFM